MAKKLELQTSYLKESRTFMFIRTNTEKMSIDMEDPALIKKSPLLHSTYTKKNCWRRSWLNGWDVGVIEKIQESVRLFISTEEICLQEILCGF